MSTSLDETHEPNLQSWVDSANALNSDFPIQNLPFGRFRRSGTSQAWRIGVAIGDQILDLSAAGLIDTTDMNALMARSRDERVALRRAISRALRRNADRSRVEGFLTPQSAAEMAVPCDIGDYTDFYTSIHHATTVGKQFRPDNPLLPNYKWVPIGYHGRASSIRVSGPGTGHTFRRPVGQTMKPDATAPSFGPSARLDYELELAVYIAQSNTQGEPVPLRNAEEHVFGLGLFNDWTARDIQSWEYQPLGPFLSKNFASTLSPWIVTTEALAPFRRPFTRPEGDPRPLPYLESEENNAVGAIDVQLEVWLQTPIMRQAGQPGERLTVSNYTDAYWTVAQLVAHHTVNGCNLRTGDVFGSGTLSGPAPEQGGSLLELTQGGKRAIRLKNGETRTFLEDGDTIILRGWCERAGAHRIGFGECRGTVMPARRSD